MEEEKMMSDKEKKEQFQKAFFDLVEKDYSEVVKVLLNYVDVNAKNPAKRTALILAAKNGNEETTKVLLEAGADVNAVDYFEWTALINAADDGYYSRVVKVLLEFGADVNYKTEEGITALGRASVSGDSKSVRLLLEHGADVNVRDNEDWTPLMFASNLGNKEVVKVLLEAGADVNIKNNENKTACDLAKGSGFSFSEDEKEILEMLKQAEVKNKQN